MIITVDNHLDHALPDRRTCDEAICTHSPALLRIELQLSSV